MGGGAKSCAPFSFAIWEDFMSLFALKRARVAVFAILGVLAASSGRAQTSTERIEIDGNASSHPVAHFWEKMFGSGSAILTLRESYRQVLREKKSIADFGYVW